jgi:hypothetical protein
MTIFFMVWSPGWWHQNFKSAKLFPARSVIVTALALGDATACLDHDGGAALAKCS